MIKIRCKGMTKKGGQCSLTALTDSDFCAMHQFQNNWKLEDVDGDGIDDFVCPYCNAQIFKNIDICPHCQSNLVHDPAELIESSKDILHQIFHSDLSNNHTQKSFSVTSNVNGCCGCIGSILLMICMVYALWMLWKYCFNIIIG